MKEKTTEPGLQLTPKEQQLIAEQRLRDEKMAETLEKLQALLTESGFTLVIDPQSPVSNPAIMLRPTN